MNREVAYTRNMKIPFLFIFTTTEAAAAVKKNERIILELLK
jgi:hypothetical protein